MHQRIFSNLVDKAFCWELWSQRERERDTHMEISSSEKARSVIESMLAASIPKTEISLIIVTE